MTNKQRQEELDKQKWVFGETVCVDPSGAMPYCAECKYQKDSFCQKNQQEREEGSLCAKAYNLLYHNRGKKK